ncbi:probable peroxisomal acyl-coenzyme A oxidase 1 [Adelges cooleyi]|uniref:probable peroxisomal acyl-coenzyme A oxidase 1 n=1 Tax=Adelges cooleyi TaxID=133065 RepID=UPI0021801BA7|nr:probable peroxisomal acyl-coenzyme A oxidase 1 [Adelges cooleyi]
MIKQTINEDLLAERSKCTFNVEELTNFFDGGVSETESRRKMENFFLFDPRFKDKVPMEYLSHQEHYEEGIRKSCILHSKVNEWANITNTNRIQVYTELWNCGIASAIVKQGIPFGVHSAMFLPALFSQGASEQHNQWLELALNNAILGTYAQTELGHGTFIRGLETTSTYDSNTEEFILNSPTQTSYKWWPGGLGHTCNYAIVVAQLYTQGKIRGIHQFVVQIRDSETWMPMPGIKIGEIGSKFGMNSANNGYLALNNVRIPRMNMLMKNSRVLKDGTYEKSSNQKLNYGTMVFMRVLIVKNLVANYLMEATTIAVRYSAVRRQSELRVGEREPQIMDYQTQQYKLFPLIATGLAYKFVANWLWEAYNEVTSELDRGNVDLLPELHAMACCLKAVGTYDAATGVTTCRLACGGHGYMHSSNLPNIYTLTTAAEIYEGENTVLLLQTARYLMKAYQELQRGNDLAETVSYLNHYQALKQSAWTTTLECMTNAFFQVAGSKIENCYKLINHSMNNGLSYDEAWNQTSIQLLKASEAHCRAWVINIFMMSLKKMQVSAEIIEVITQLCELICAQWTLNSVGDFLQYSNLNVSDVPSIQNLMENCLKLIRPNAVGLVDSFDLRDEILNSTLGSYDGNVYERLLQEANKSPLNKNPVNKSFELYLKPFLKSNM